MKSFSAFLPIDRRIALDRGEALPERAWGAVLFADISGFSVLTSLMAREYGPQRGAEAIAGWLNRVYGALINCVHNHHGSVVSFNGDSITCWFDDQPAGNPSGGQAAPFRAAACAFAMQETIGQFRAIQLPSDKTISLHIKVAVAAGAVRRFDVGRPEMQRIDILAGSLLDRVSAAESLLSQDEVAVGEEIADLLGPGLEVQAWRIDDDFQRFAIVSELRQAVPEWPWAETPDLTEDVTGRWLWAPVYERLNMAEGAFLAELRPSVVVLYLSFSGLDYDDDDDVQSRLDRFVSSVQLILSRYEGVLLQLTTGDKGSYLLATFGAIRAHEDDPARALEAALMLQALPADLLFIKDIRIGISRGMLYTGAFGGGMRQTYGVLGSEANVGARLMSAASPGQTVVSSAVFEVTAARYAYDELGFVPLKGVAEPRLLYLLSGKQQGLEMGATAPFMTPMVGRSRERAALSAQLAALQNGRSGTVIIEGDPGIGKSRLSMAFLEEARACGLPILFGAGDDIERGTPYYAWRPVFRTIFDLAETSDPAACQDKILAELPNDPEIRQLAPLLNAVLPTNFADNELTGNMAGEARAISTRNLLVNLLARTIVQSSGLVLLLEDAHWLDSASWALAAQVRQSLSPLLLVIVARPMVKGAAQAKEAESLLAEGAAERISLSSLSPDEIILLVLRRLGVNSLPQPIVDLILNQGEGNPFYSEEIAYALRDTGTIRIDDGQATLADQSATHHTIDFPATIQGVITSRIDQLDASEQLTLKVASVIGRIFAFQVLCNIYPDQSIAPVLPDQLVKFDQLDITALEAPEPELAYLFKHIITQEVVYNLMTFSQRQWLHRSAAEWYEARYAADLGPFYPLLAYHWRGAEETTRAISYLEKAGQQALRDNANKEAIDFFSEIRELAAAAGLQSSALERAEWARKIADGYLGLGDIMTARTYYEEAAGLLNQPIPQSGPSLSLALLGQLGTQTLHRLWPSRFLHRAKAGDALLESARAYHGLGFIYYVSNDTLPFVHATLKGLNLAELAGLSRPLAEGYATLCVIASFLPGDRLSELYARLAMNAAEKLNDPSVLGNVLIRIAVYHSGMAHWRRAETSADQAIAKYERINDLRGWGDSVNVQLYTLYYTGRFDECLALGQALYQTAQRNENVQHQAWGLWMSAKSLIRLGRYDEAAEFLEQAKAANALENLHIVGSLALAYWYLGLPQQALETIRGVDISIGEASPGFATLSANANVAEAYILAWEALQVETTEGSPLDPALLPELKAGARQACKILHGFCRIFPIGKPAAWLYQGNLDWLEGKTEKAYKAWQKSIAFATQFSMPYELARAHFAIGRHLPPEDPERQSYLRIAVENFMKLGASGDLQRALKEQETT